MTGRARSAEHGQPFVWPSGKRAAISLSFDDARPSQLDVGLPILDAHGVKATFYVSPAGVEKRPGDWRRVRADGHEIGSHTLRHPCSGNFAFARGRALEDWTLEQMEADLTEADAFLRQALGATPVTFAYPCGQTFVGRGRGVRSYVPLVAERFVAGRGFRDEGANDPGFCDLAQVMGRDADGAPFEQVLPWVEKAASEGGWLVLVGHDVGEGARQTFLAGTLDALCRHARDPASGLWIDTVAAVAAYIRGVRTGL